MPSRRQQSSRLSATPTRRSKTLPSSDPSQPGLPPLPDYVPPSAPLNDAAISSLENLQSASRNVERLMKAQTQALEYLQDAAAAIYERATVYHEYYDKGKSQLEALEKSLGNSQDQNEEDAGINLQEKVRAKRIEVKRRKDDAEELELHAKKAHDMIESKVRQVIDGKVRIEDHAAVLGEVSGNVHRGEGRVAPTQSTLGASQFRGQEDDAGALTTHMSTLDSQVTAGVSILESVNQKLGCRKDTYDRLGKRARYAEHNDYIGFKRIVHDAMHPEDGVDIAHSSTWFPGEGETNGDSTDPSSTIPGSIVQDEEVDSDIEIARERISTKCPITLVSMKDPLTSPCNHNFEAEAILSMLKSSSQTVGGQMERRGRREVLVGGEKTIRCPVASCQESFTEKGLRRDAMMCRKIKRLQEQDRAREEEEFEEDAADDDAEEDSGQRARAISVGTEAESRRQSLAPRVKSEIRSSMAPRATFVASTPRDQSVTVDNEDDMDEDYDDEE